MKEREKAEIDRIVCEIADEGVSAERIRKLEDLLLNRPDLQSHYSNMTRLGTLLRCEFGESSLNAQAVVAPAEQGDMPEGACASLVNRVERDVATPNWTRRIALLTGIAAMLVIGYGLLRPQSDELQPLAQSTQDNTELGGDSQAGASAESTLASLPIRNLRDLEVLSRITRTEAIQCLWLPRRESKGIAGVHQSGWELSGGNAWIDRSVGGRDRGYVVSVPPGVRMDMRVDTDACCQNALGMVELNQKGRMSGATIAFNNLSAGNSADSERLTGCIGHYSVNNDASGRRNFLIAGSYCVERPDGTGDWKQSDYALLFESHDLLVIGFDDSGYSNVEIGQEDDRDRDFNDMCAFIHFSSADGPSRRVPTGVSYVPASIEDPLNRVEKQNGYLLAVRPGEKLLIAVTSSASLQNSVRIIEENSRQVIWQHDGSKPGTSDSSFQMGQRGIYLVYNNSDTVRRYELQGRSITETDDGEGTWIDSPHSVLDEGDNWVSIGFEDSPDKPLWVDWNDIRVHASWFTD